jgi:hypothetical protein
MGGQSHASRRTESPVPRGGDEPTYQSAAAHSSDAADALTRLAALPGGRSNVVKGRFKKQDSDRWDVFVSYCKPDQKYWKRISTFLVPMRRHGVKIYSYDIVQPGAVILDGARSALLTSIVAVLLMSADYLASGLMDLELPSLLDQVEVYGARILWLQVGLFDSSYMKRLTRYQKVGAGSDPLDSLSGPQRDAVYLELVEAIRSNLDQIRGDQNPPTDVPEET